MNSYAIPLLPYDSYASVELSSFSWRFYWHSVDLYDVCGTANLVDWRKWEREDYSNKDLLFPFFHFLDTICINESLFLDLPNIRSFSLKFKNLINSMFYRY